MKHWVSCEPEYYRFRHCARWQAAVIAARGEVFTVPAKEGSIRNLTHSPGVREQHVAWSPNGQWIAYISDRTGEDEIYIISQDGLAPEEQITSGHKGFMFQPAWSPDSSKIAWADKDLKLWYVDQY
jgi:tricorn protease